MINPTAMATIRLLIDCRITEPEMFLNRSARVFEMSDSSRPALRLRKADLARLILPTNCPRTMVGPDRSPALIHLKAAMQTPQAELAQGVTPPISWFSRRKAPASS